MFQALYKPIVFRIACVVLCLSASMPIPAAVQVLEPEQARADLERLYKGLVSAEADLFAATPKHEFDRLFEQLNERYTVPISVVELFRDFQSFAALARHGHTRLEGLNPAWPDYSAGGGRVFPLGFSIHQGEVIVESVPPESGIQPGDRIISINEKANPVWLDEVTRFISAETPALAYSMLENGEFYYFWLAYGALPQFVVTVDQGGTEKQYVLEAVAVDALDSNVRLEPGFNLAGREAKLIEPQIGYLRPGPFYHYQAESPEDVYNPEALAAYTAFVDEAFRSFIQSGAKHLILDLRDNPGGDASFSDPVVAWFATKPFRFASEFRIRVSAETTASNQARLASTPAGEGSVSHTFAKLFASAENGDRVLFDIPNTPPRKGERFEGDVHVLVNRYSYSNAVSVAALIQDYGFGTIYGEQTRDMATTYGAMEHFDLPHSGFKVGYPKAHIIRPNGTLQTHPVSPDISLSVPALRGAKDSALDELVRRIGRQR